MERIKCKIKRNINDFLGNCLGNWELLLNFAHWKKRRDGLWEGWNLQNVIETWTVCSFKLRNFEPKYSGDAWETCVVEGQQCPDTRQFPYFCVQRRGVVLNVFLWLNDNDTKSTVNWVLWGSYPRFVALSVKEYALWAYAALPFNGRRSNLYES